MTRNCLFSMCLLIIAFILIGIIEIHNVGVLLESSENDRSNDINIITTMEQMEKKSLECQLNASIYEKSIPVTSLYSRKDIHTRFTLPLYLYSEGGSGNTMVRTILEYVTGISTGSPFKDDTFISIFNHEGQCYDGLLVCKAHPRWFYISGIGLFGRNWNGNWKESHRGLSLNITNKSDGLVWIIRDPWHSMWSLYQLISGGFTNHINRIRTEDFNKDHFMDVLWKGTNIISLVEHWKQQFVVAFGLKNNRSWTNNNIIMIKYEDLLDKNKRFDKVMQILNHLYVLNDSTINDKYFVIPSTSGLMYLSYNKLKCRIECAFKYCDNIHEIKREHEHYVNVTTMNDAYLSLGINIICNVWHSLKIYAKPLGYKQLFLEMFDCNSLNITYNIIDNINIPNLTHKRLWSKKRKELMRKNMSALSYG